MVDLKKDLDEYLLLQSDQKKSFKLQIPTIQKPNLTNWFKREEPTEDNSWFQETKKGCCPSLVSRRRRHEHRQCGMTDFRRGFNG
jgi:hypothetical protein